MKILRSIGGVVAGVIVAGILVFAVQMIAHVVYPPPAGIDPSTSEGQKALADYVAKAPPGVFLFVLASYAVPRGGFSRRTFRPRQGGLLRASSGRRERADAAEERCVRSHARAEAHGSIGRRPTFRFSRTCRK